MRRAFRAQLQPDRHNDTGEDSQGFVYLQLVNSSDDMEDRHHAN